MTKLRKDFVSVVIINWNGMRWLDECLKSITSQTYPHFEVIVVDNASQDGSIEFISQHYPEIFLIKNTKNEGFAKGNNLALPHAKGELILLLNNDTTCPNNFIELFVESFQKIPKVGAAQSKIIKMSDPTKLDSCGSFWTNSTLLYHYGVDKSESLNQFNQDFPVFSNKGASMLIRRDVIEKIGLFDDDFWCYYEETDFCNRVWLIGFECWYLPKAMVLHAIGGTSTLFNNDQIQFHNFKNKLLSFIKNFEIKTLFTVIPTYIFLSAIISLIYLALNKPKHALAVLKAIIWNIKNIKSSLQKRKKIQDMRTITDANIFNITKRKPRLIYYYRLLTGALAQYKE